MVSQLGTQTVRTASLLPRIKSHRSDPNVQIVFCQTRHRQPVYNFYCLCGGSHVHLTGSDTKQPGDAKTPERHTTCTKLHKVTQSNNQTKHTQQPQSETGHEPAEVTHLEMEHTVIYRFTGVRGPYRCEGSLHVCVCTGYLMCGV